MSVNTKNQSTPERRFFFSDGTSHFQLLKFIQRPDSSIYISSPNLSECKWMEIVPENPLALRVNDIPGAGKLSVHGSGITHVRHKQTGETEMRLAGNYLINKEEQSIGARHLITIFLTEPTYIPSSPMNNRRSDCGIKADVFKPYVLIFWAIPSTQRITFEIGASFFADDLESVPPESGFGTFGLRTHTIAWFAYRTKHMERWPVQSHLCFHDGFHVPVIIGTGEGEARMEIRTPEYSLSEQTLGIKL